MDILLHIELAFWLAIAAIGFAVLFNVPKRTLIIIAILAALGGSSKLILMHYGGHIIIGSMVGATLIGLLSIPAAHGKHAPPLVFSIPAVIPMIPGAFAYKAMLGFIKLTGDISLESYQIALDETVNNGLKAVFIIFALTAGVSFPMLISRKESAKEIKI
ncbi:threonine/serine exporter family protein [Wenyingzhuangia sp. chi5]|uniref:Threonine/serine exporter family protein n=1 Tax=Wenyingzhuangia gilva TaxID=3057677 RepID=A0ABT8VPR4_9FLAO|nr:threonine/serine exporter family protein [Wenyingzhuangia sp. chi5]MDO3693953.1 threonine/serine exporter family protein [Wenyingzhuangia sp. chi5]